MNPALLKAGRECHFRVRLQSHVLSREDHAFLYESRPHMNERLLDEDGPVLVSLFS